MKYNKMDGMLVLEVVDSNPNGDPDYLGNPRQRDNGIGEISPVSIKRKYRDMIEYKENNYIWEEVGAGLNPDNFEILESKRNNDRARIRKIVANDAQGFLDMFWDARLFGNTFLEKGISGHERSGALQLGLGLSVAPIEIRKLSLTKKMGAQDGKDSGFAPDAYSVVPYGIYTVPVYFSPQQAGRNGCTDDDLDMFLKLTPYIYDHNRSLIRTHVNILHAHMAFHHDKNGSYNPYTLLDELRPTLIEDRDGSTLGDYNIPTWDTVKDKFPGVAEYLDVSILPYELRNAA